MGWCYVLFFYMPVHKANAVGATKKQLDTCRDRVVRTATIFDYLWLSDGKRVGQPVLLTERVFVSYNRVTMKPLQGKIALITGASQGIGKSIAQKFAAAGADIVFTYLSDDAQGQALAEEFRAMGGRVDAYRSDAADRVAVEALVQEVVRTFGRLDIVVNNAGIARDDLLLRMDEQAWDEVIRVNLKSCFNTVKAATRTFLKQRSGVIINISSVVGLKGNAGQANYAASKAGVIGFTKSVALELGTRNVRSNAIAPGFIETAMTQGLSEEALQDWKKAIPLQRAGLPEDVANCALFLASDAASYITGQVIQVDGGLLT